MRPTTALLAFFAATFVVAGCGHSGPTANSTTDPAAQYAGEQGVENSTTAMPDEFESTTYNDGVAAKADISAFGVGTTVEAAIDPAMWFRLIRRVDRKFVIEFEHPDSNTIEAHVRIVDHLVGTFNVITQRDTLEGGNTDRRWIQKPLDDRGVRKAVFVRKRVPADSTGDGEDREDGFADGWSPWRLVALSGAEITSDGGTRTIQSVEVQSGTTDVTVTDALELVRRNQLPILAPGAEVHVIATTGDASDVVVLYARWGRMRMRPTGTPGQFEARFLAPSQGGLRHLAVNALSHGTLFDDALPYDSKAWALPFRVVAPDVAAN
jgi:hypothetical protein